MNFNSAGCSPSNPFVFHRRYKPHNRALVSSSSFLVQLNLPNTAFKLIGVNGNNYTALQLHFHWVTKLSSENEENAGSEHTINGQHYDAEVS